MTYSIGNIYKIICKLDSNIIYIGSTFNQLRHRFQGHKTQFKKWLKDKDKNTKCSIFDYFEKYGIENFKIILIKSYNVVRTHQRDHKHLWAYELLWINKTNNCCNIQLPFNPLYNKKEYKKKYDEEHKEDKKEKGKKYREEHKEHKKEYMKKYNEEHKNKVKECQKKWYKKNKEKVKEQVKKWRENKKKNVPHDLYILL
jgi:hypothetical protein